MHRRGSGRGGSPAGHAGREDDRAGAGRAGTVEAPGGLDSLYSIVQMPRGIPVATFAIGEAGAVNAALFAVAMLAAGDDALAARLDDYRAEQSAKAEAMVLPPGGSPEV